MIAVGFGIAVLIFAGFLAASGGGIGPLAVLIGGIGAVIGGWGIVALLAGRRP